MLNGFYLLQFALEVDLSAWSASTCFRRARLSGSSSRISTKAPKGIFSASFPGTGGNSTDKRSGSGSLGVGAEAVCEGAGCCDPAVLPLLSPMRRGVGTAVCLCSSLLLGQQGDGGYCCRWRDSGQVEPCVTGRVLMLAR